MAKLSDDPIRAALERLTVLARVELDAGRIPGQPAWERAMADALYALAAAPKGEGKSRKFVQLMVDGDGYLCAVADDGTAWWHSSRERCWKQFDALPAHDLPLPAEEPQP